MEARRVGIFCFYAAALLLSAVSAASADEGGFAGSESCRDCHQQETKSFAKNNHGNKLDPGSPANVKGCESCHGPRLKHVESDGEEKGQPVSAAACQECHKGSKLALWEGSEHERRDVSCTNCHNPHAGNKKNLVKPTEAEVCAQCHKDIRAELQKSSHHPIREGKMTCSECHNPHGTVTEKLISANSINEKCYECHAEKRGPFLWEHAPVTENCDTCHVPHGSSHPSLLSTKTPFLCQQCHSNAGHPGTLPALDPSQPGATVYNALGNRVYYRNCMNCHSQIHGSNHPSGKSLGR